MYDLDINKAVDLIEGSNAKKVLLQLPDGLKPEANKIQEQILKSTNAEIYIWAGSCYGACDVPVSYAKQLNFDLIIQWGHAKWK